MFFVVTWHLFLLVDKLALVAVGAPAGRCFMPLLAVLRLVVPVHVCRPKNELFVAVRVHALLIEFTVTFLHEITTQLSLVVDTEVFDVLEHLFARGKIHELLLPLILVWQTKTLLHLQLLKQFLRVARVLICDFVELGGEVALLSPVDGGA